MSSYRYCPACTHELAAVEHAGRLRSACSQCGFIHWDNPLPVVAALTEVEGRILLARNSAWREGMFGLITGFMERDETPEQAVGRELKEETNLDAQHIELIGVYEFIQKNELIIAYHVRAEGTIQLSDELVDYRLVAPERLRPWRMGTGLAMADWMTRRGLPFEFIDLPARPEPASAAQ